MLNGVTFPLRPAAVGLVSYFRFMSARRSGSKATAASAAARLAFFACSKVGDFCLVPFSCLVGLRFCKVGMRQNSSNAGCRDVSRRCTSTVPCTLNHVMVVERPILLVLLERFASCRRRKRRQDAFRTCLWTLAHESQQANVAWGYFYYCPNMLCNMALFFWPSLPNPTICSPTIAHDLHRFCTALCLAPCFLPSALTIHQQLVYVATIVEAVKTSRTETERETELERCAHHA